MDCVVFAERGARPHPDECSGSDLDGDQYFVAWDPDLQFPGPNRPPMDFHSQPPLEIPACQVCSSGTFQGTLPWRKGEEMDEVKECKPGRSNERQGCTMAD